MNPTQSEAEAAKTAPPAQGQSGSDLVHRRGLNASLETLRAGLPAIARLQYSDRNLFLFRNGQLRRQFGEGHSHFERTLRRLKRRADYSSRREYKRARRQDEFETAIVPELDRIRAIASTPSAIWR